MRYVIVIDDDDREEAPNRPWTAGAYRDWDGERGETIHVEAGIGATVSDAIRDLLNDAELRRLSGFCED